ncbi:hypothetical protein B7463_g3387, partial [Scytalidium lignicola]
MIKSVSAAGVGNELCVGIPKPSRSNVVRRDAIILSAVTYPIVALRFYQRWSVAHHVWWDDCAALIATIFLAAVDGMEIASTTLGFGSHYWNVPSSNVMMLTCVFVPAALLDHPDILHRRTAFIISHATSFIFAIIFQCHPIDSIWDRSIKGKCINLEVVGFAGAAASIFEDVVILILPVSELNSINLGAKKKLSLVFMFSIGSFACVTSMVRLKYLTQFGRSYDLTWDNVDVLIWSSIELHTALICACLPSLRSLLVKVFPVVFKTTLSTSRDTNRRASHPMINLRRIGRAEDSYAGLPDGLETMSTAVGTERWSGLGIGMGRGDWEVTIVGGGKGKI